MFSMLPVITNIEFTDSHLDRKHGSVIHVCGDAPPGKSRSAGGVEFWKHSKRLTPGSLVAIVTKSAGKPATASLAVIAFCESARAARLLL